MNKPWMSDEEFDKIFEEKSSEINEQLESEILIAMIGDVNAGKSSTINRLMGDDVAQVGAKPGETQEINKFSYKDKIIFVDTPGLDDIYSEHSEETIKFYKQADLILFFLNAAGTVLSDTELKSLKKIAKVNKDLILVLNKIDAADDIPSLVKYVQDHTGYEYPVTPISSRTGENMGMLQKEVLSLLEAKKKDILMAANMADKSTIANRWDPRSWRIGRSDRCGSDSWIRFRPIDSVAGQSHAEAFDLVRKANHQGQRQGIDHRNNCREYREDCFPADREVRSRRRHGGRG